MTIMSLSDIEPPKLYHCKECQVGWYGQPECWSCGEEGFVGKISYIALQITPSSAVLT